MIKIQRISNGQVVLIVIGDLHANNVVELSALLDREAADRELALDLRDLVFADRQAVGFLQQCETAGIALRNCPGYIRAWIASWKD